MLASMSEMDPSADTPLVDWSELSVSRLLPTGTVTLLLGRRRGLHQAVGDPAPGEDSSLAPMKQTVSEIIVTHDGVRPVEQGEGDSFVAAVRPGIGRAGRGPGDATRAVGRRSVFVGCAPARCQLRDEREYAGPAINRAARLRDLGHGGQTLLSGTTESLVLDRLPGDAWLTDLGTHPLRDLCPLFW